MRIATWNINGIKARLANLAIWLEQEQPDIVCLQEIKSLDSLFPREKIENLGYHIETHGQKSFNGVALLSKMPPEEVSRGLPVLENQEEDSQARYIEAVYSTQNSVIRVASLYFPNGNPVFADSKTSQKTTLQDLSNKYRYKLEWMKRLKKYTDSRLKLEENFILAGDYNVIPTAQDAAQPDKWQQDALFLPATREAYNELINLGFTNAIRAVSNQTGYSFWDYQAGAWNKDNGILIDHLLLSPEATGKLKNAYIQKEVRGWEKASDHVPVWIDLDVEKL